MQKISDFFQLLFSWIQFTADVWMFFSGRNDGNGNCYLSRPFAVNLSWFMCFAACLTERLCTCKNKNRLPESSLFFLNNQPDFPTLEELSASVLTANSMTTNAAARGFSFFFFPFHASQNISRLSWTEILDTQAKWWIYLWNVDGGKKKTNKQWMTVRRCNHFRWNIWIMAVRSLQRWTISSLTNQESHLVFMSCICVRCNIYLSCSVPLPQRARKKKETTPQ